MPYDWKRHDCHRLTPEQAEDLARRNAAPLVRSELDVLWDRVDRGLATEDDTARLIAAIEERAWRVGQSGHRIPLDSEQLGELAALAALAVSQRGGSFTIRSASGSIEWWSDGITIRPRLPL